MEVLLDEAYAYLETDSLPDFEQDQDGSFGYDKDYLTNPSKPYEVESKVLSPADIQSQQDRQFSRSLINNRTTS